MEDLIEAQLEDDDHVAIEFVERPPREVRDQVVDAALPAHGARDDVGGQRPVTFVLQVFAGSDECRRQLGASRSDRAKRLERRGSRRSGHGAMNLTPAATGRPAR